VAFAAALSAHPVSSHATGEVVGRLFEANGPRPDLVVLLATPGHRGALEDIVATARRLLEPGLLLAAVTTGLGVGDDHIGAGPGLAAWSGTCAPVAPASVDAPFEVTGALVLGTAGLPQEAAGRLYPGAPLVAGTVAGPVVLDGTAVGPAAWAPAQGRAGGPLGVVFGPGSGFSATVAHGLRGVGPGLEVTRADGGMVYELDGQPALRRLVDVARDGMPATELARLGEGLHLRPAPGGAGPGGDPLPVLGADRDNGAIAVRGPVATGEVVQFALADRSALWAALGRSLGGLSEAAVVLTPAVGSPSLGAAVPGPESGPDRGSEGLAALGTPLPAATLLCETLPAEPDGRGRRRAQLETTTVAYFT
jgi:small ligand-binding sensory domain FIST